MGGAGQGETTTGGRDPALVLGELMRLSTVVAQLMAQELGLSVGDLNALHHLVGRGPLGPAELGKRLAISSASATVLADRLERAGYVRRRPDPSDRRRIVLEVTDAAAARSLAAVHPLITHLTAIDDEFDEPTRQTITAYLARAAEAMEAFTDTNQPRPRQPALNAR